jgi:putative ABC transport system substrate-binding protein
MRRREFIGLVGGVAAWPLEARAQQSTRVHHIALAHPSNPVSTLSETGTPFYRAFFEELRRLGYVEGRNLAVARYSAEGRNERHAEIAREVVRTKPEVVVTVGSRMALSFMAASSTIPVVAIAGDPVALGVAASLARPGKNFTGSTSNAGPEYYAKLLQLFKEAIPTLSTVGIIAPPAPWTPLLASQQQPTGNPVGLAMQDAALSLGIQLVPGLLGRYEEDDYRNLFGAMVQKQVDAILTSDLAENFTHRRLILELAETNRLPTMSLYTEIVEIGGLIAYAPDLKAQFRYLAFCVDKILRGENPGEIPIYQSARFNLAINLKTAKALGLVIPASLVARADLVIE